MLPSFIRPLLDFAGIVECTAVVMTCYRNKTKDWQVIVSKKQQ